MGAITSHGVEMMKNNGSKALLLCGVLGAAMMSSPVFAANASKCSGQGIANGAALEHKLENGVCGNDQGTPVPEPSGVALLATGLVAMGIRQIRKSKRA
jgi:hypothetical protein